MLEEKIARLAADFAARIIGVLTAAPLEELVDLASGPRPRARPAPAPRSQKPRKAPRRAMPQAATEAPAAPSVAAPTRVAPSAEVTAAALAFFAERGSRGATEAQVGERLAELGLPAAASVVDVLASAGTIRDAGFRRAAGKNATATVYVAS